MQEGNTIDTWSGNMGQGMWVRECATVLSSCSHDHPLKNGRCVQVTSGRDHLTFTCTPALEHSLLRANVKLGNCPSTSTSTNACSPSTTDYRCTFSMAAEGFSLWRSPCEVVIICKNIRVVLPFFIVHCQKTHNCMCMQGMCHIDQWGTPAHPKCLALVHYMNYTPMYMHILYMYIQYESIKVAVLLKGMLL